MAEIRAEGEVNARVIYWGIEGAGKSTNLQAVYAKLRPDHRGELREVPTRLDPTVSYPVLPIELGEIAGVRTRLEIVAAPSGPDQAPTRKQLLDRIDGVVAVFDSRPERLDENLAIFEELRQGLAAYGTSIDRVPLVIQYNKRDLADPFALESLHRKLDVGSIPVFETVASEGSGVLETLSTISKRVIRSLRDQEMARGDAQPAAKPAQPEIEPEAPAPPAPAPAERMEQAILEEAGSPEAEAAALDVETALDTPAWDEVSEALEVADGLRLPPDLRIVSVGPAERTGERRVRVPLVLGDGDGHTARLALSIDLEPLLDEDP
jgi:signal recognition particle receptor subunit beta